MNLSADRLIIEDAFAYIDKKAPVLFLILSMQGRIIEANHYAETLAGRGLSGEDFQNLVLDFTGTFDLDEVVQEDSKEHLLNIETAGGLPQSYYFSFRRIREQILVFGRLDVNEMEEMRKSILSLNNELNNLTRRLHKKNAQLLQLNMEKNRFIGMAAHDLRKPIGLIIMYSEFLIEETGHLLDIEHKGFLDTINSTCTFMKRLVDDFLDVAAIEAGKFELDLHPASISDIMDQSLRFNQFAAQKKGIDIARSAKGPFLRFIFLLRINLP